MTEDKSVPLALACLLFFAATVLLATGSENTSDGRLLAPPPEKVELFHFGFPGSLADSLWLRWIQDADFCFSYFGNVDLEVEEKPDTAEKYAFYNPRRKKCDQSWGFKMLDAVTKLDPKFEMPYLAGAMALSVLVEDYEGAEVIFDRGLENYPNNWQLAYRASYHYLFDKREYQKAASLLVRAAENGGPSWFQSLAARLYTKTGQLELALTALVSFRRSYPEGHQGLKVLDSRLKEIQEEIAKSRQSGP